MDLVIYTPLEVTDPANFVVLKESENVRSSCKGIDEPCMCLVYEYADTYKSPCGGVITTGACFIQV